MAFALGEVTSLYTGGIIRISIITVMLICCAAIMVRKPEYKWPILVLLAGMTLGILNIFIRGDAPEIITFFENLKKHDNGNYTDIDSNSDDEIQLVVFGGSRDSRLPVSAYGLVWDIIKGKNGNNVVVKIDDIQIEYNNQKYIQSENTNSYKIMLYGLEEDIEIGRRIYVSGELKVFNSNTNPGGFNIKGYYNSMGIYFYMNKPEIKHCSELSTTIPVCKVTSLYLYYKDGLRRIRNSLENKLHILTDDESADIYSGILLGNKSGIDTDVKQLYRINGIAHILAISGLHISIIGGMLYRILRRLGMRVLASGICSIFIIISYGFMTGFAAATIRAVVMLSMYIWGEVIGRNYDMLTGLGLSLLTMLVVQPLRIYDSGMVLSFTAMFGVAMGRYILSKLSEKPKLIKLKKRNKFLYSLLSSLIFSASVNAIITPVIIYIYFEIPLYSLLINMLVIPLMSIIVASGILSLFVSYFNIGLAKIIILPGELVLKLYDEVCNFAVKLPYNTINTGKVHILQIIIYYACIVALLILSIDKVQRKIRNIVYKYKKIWFSYTRWNMVVGLLMLTTIMISMGAVGIIHLINKRESIVFLDVGQGDGILIRSSGGTNIVIDGGSVTNSSLGEYTLVPAIKYMAMANIDYWFITHTDIDHTSGLEYILTKGELTSINIKYLVISEYIEEDEAFDNLMSMAEAYGVDVIKMDINDHLTDGTFEMVCCHPDSAYKAEDKNQASIGLSYKSDTFSALFCGDMGTDALEYMTKNHIELLEKNYNVVKVPHHGSKNSIYKELYASLLSSDSRTVISCGLNNRYGHPHNETLEVLNETGAHILRTDYHGAIMFIAQ